MHNGARHIEPPEAPQTILGLPGSLRAGSFNKRLLGVAANVAPPSVQLVVKELGSIPLFNEDLEGSDYEPPSPVRALRAAIGDARAILIATPEYNQSMPGVLKNAIDWLSRPAPDSAFQGKPVALIGVTSGEWGTRLSQAALRQTLFAAGAKLIPLHLYLRKADALFEPDGADGRQLVSQLRDYMGALASEVANSVLPAEPG